jgi:hypothetical protein
MRNNLIAVSVTVPTVVAFDYNTVPKDVAVMLRPVAADIKARITRTTQDIIATGCELAKAKEHLDHGQFIAWVESEIGIDRRTAQRYMAAAQFAEGKNDTVSLLPPSTVHRLASKSAPVEVVKQVVAKAAAGTIVSDRAVVEMIAEAKHRRRQIEANVRCAERDKRRSKKKRLEAEQRQQEWEQKRQRERERVQEAASHLWERLGAVGVAMLLDAMSDNPFIVLEELRKFTSGAAA